MMQFMVCVLLGLQYDYSVCLDMILRHDGHTSAIVKAVRVGVRLDMPLADPDSALKLLNAGVGKLIVADEQAAFVEGVCRSRKSEALSY